MVSPRLVAGRLVRRGRPSLGCAAVVFATVVFGAAPARARRPEESVWEQMQLQPLSFTVNDGQWADSILCRATGGGVTTWFTSGGVYYEFVRKTPGRSSEDDAVRPSDRVPADDALECHLLRASFEGADPSPEIRADSLTAYECNFFLGSDSTRWRTHVPNYQSVTYAGIYAGIDLRFHGDGHQMEYDFIAAPGADLAQIAVHYDGAESVTVDAAGDLVVSTEWAKVTEHAPVVYQDTPDGRHRIAAVYEMKGDNTFGFRLTGEYDQFAALVIDPTLTFSTYLGGSSFDAARDMQVTSDGQVFLAGATYSSDFPAVNAYDGTYNDDWDMFVTLVAAAGNSLVYSTYIGGSGSDNCEALALLGDQSTSPVFLTGATRSTDFPLVNPLDATADGSDDVFVLELGSGGSGLAFSTYLGGSDSDVGWDLAVRCPYPCLQPTQNIWVTGRTASTNFPTLNAYSSTRQGNNDAFLTEIHLGQFGANSILYSTYFGGSLTDQALGLTVIGYPTFIPIITGQTSSTDFPVAGTPYDTALAGTADAFVTAFAVGGNGQVYPSFSTYFGGVGNYDNYEFAADVLVNSAGHICIAGTTGSNGLATADAYQRSVSGSTFDAFVAEFDATASSLLYCTYLGGYDNDHVPMGVHGLAVDGDDNVYLAGETESSAFPLHDAFDSTLSGTIDAFVARFSPDLGQLRFSSLLGGSDDDHPAAIKVDGNGCLYVTGYTSSSDFPVVDPYDGAFSVQDAFLTKICLPQYVCGDVDGNGTGPNIGDITYLVSYIFQGGPPPPTVEAADLDGSGAVNIADLTYLVSFIFQGGPAPTC